MSRVGSTPITIVTTGQPVGTGSTPIVSVGSGLSEEEEGAGGGAGSLLIVGSDYRMGRHNGRRTVLLDGNICASGS